MTVVYSHLWYRYPNCSDTNTPSSAIYYPNKFYQNLFGYRDPHPCLDTETPRYPNFDSSYPKSDTDTGYPPISTSLFEQILSELVLIQRPRCICIWIDFKSIFCKWTYQDSEKFMFHCKLDLIIILSIITKWMENRNFKLQATELCFKHVHLVSMILYENYCRVIINEPHRAVEIFFLRGHSNNTWHLYGLF